MKRLMTIALGLLAGLTACAQGKWTTYEVLADELTGEPGGKYMKFVNDTIGSVTVREGDDLWMLVETCKGRFYGVLSGNNGTTGHVDVLIGLYDDSGKLVEKNDATLHGIEHLNFSQAFVDTNWMYYHGTKAKLKKAVAGIKSGTGSVRIVIHRVDLPDFDLKVTPFQR